MMEAAVGSGGVYHSRDIPTRLPPGDRMVRTSGLVKRYGDVTALDGLDLEVPPEAVYAIFGPNGAGKTTTLRILLDLVRPDRGRAEIFDHPTDEAGPSIRSRIGFVPERQDRNYGWMRVGRLLRFHAGYHRAWDHAYADALADELEIDPDRKYGELSKGQARRVQLLMALAHRPPLLILDEPTDGLDPVGRDRVLELVREHRARHPTTVLLCTHLVHEADRLADHVAVIRKGRLTAQVKREELDRRLRRYRADLREIWSEPPELRSPVLDRSRSGKTISWMIWGTEDEVVAELREAGAETREVTSPSLEKMALALLTRESRGSDAREPGRGERDALRPSRGSRRMSGTIAETTGHAPPGWKEVARRQVELVGRGRRRELLLLGGVMTALMLGQRFPGGSATATTSTAAQILLSSSHFLLLIVALLWPTSVWRGEGPGRRAYHWSLPVDRRVHDLLRVGAGAVWLLGTVAAGTALGLGIGVVIDGWIPAGDWRVFPGLLLALLVLYGFGSVAALASDHPFRWIIGVPVLYLGLRSIAGLVGLEAVTSALGSLETGRLGLTTALFGPRSFTSAFWEQVLGDGAPLQAGVVWLLLAAGAVFAAASLHLERTGAGS